jgi:hypothetical protein
MQPLKQALFDHAQPTTASSHSCRYNSLVAAGAMKLVKGDWPELRVLSIGWDEFAWCLCIEQRTASKGSEMLS